MDRSPPHCGNRACPYAEAARMQPTVRRTGPRMVERGYSSLVAQAALQNTRAALPCVSRDDDRREHANSRTASDTRECCDAPSGQPMSSRSFRYLQAATRLHDHLDARLDAAKGYPDQPTWGYAFSVLVSVALGQGKLTALGVKALPHLSAQEKEASNYSWEFVVYAMALAHRASDPPSSLPKPPHRAKGTRMFNWFLLRQVNRGWYDLSTHWTLLKLRLARRLYTTRTGLIVDEFRTRSLQYHAFCLYLLCDLIDQHPRARFLTDWLDRGCDFAIRQILSDGTALWIGRGQEQIFGYGALVYALEFVHHRIRPLPDATLNLVQAKLLANQRADGSFPLVLRGREPEPADASYAGRPSGWYGYNTLYDYQPFLAYALWRASNVTGRVA